MKPSIHVACLTRGGGVYVIDPSLVCLQLEFDHPDAAFVPLHSSPDSKIMWDPTPGGHTYRARDTPPAPPQDYRQRS